MKKKKESGFTLLELIIVIGIIAILSVALVIVLNPAETLKKARDAQRISDLSTLKTAIGLYVTSTSPATLSLDNLIAAANTATICTTNTAGTVGTTGPKIRYSTTGLTPGLTGTLTAGSDSVYTTWTTPGTGIVATSAGNVDGTGWIPINFTSLAGGSPISNLPVDPTNVLAATSPVSTDLAYRYGCQNLSLSTGKPSFVYEINAQLESAADTVTNDMRANDGGDNSAYYETGTSLKLLPTGVGF